MNSEEQKIAEAYQEVVEGQLICEMATIGWPKIDGVEYKFSIHGTDTRDRPIPHIHIDRADDLDRKNFKFEVSLVDMLATGEPVLVYQKDLKNGVLNTNRSKCSWDGYGRLHDGVVDYLNSGPEKNAPRNSRSNLESLVIHWNLESGSDPDKLAKYMSDRGIEVHDKYKSYFPTLYPPTPPKRKMVRNRHSVKH